MNIVITNLCKNYGSTRALDNVNLTITPNKIYGLLGRNGAGKTTLLNILTNKIFPSSGAATIEGRSVVENDAILSQIFYMMEKNLYPGSLKVKQLFYWTREFYPQMDIAYAQKLANRFNLNIDKKIGELSTGYTSIFKAILALSSNAAILIFDEPVLGLDANHREMFYKELIANYSTHPKTIIISTHLIEEVAEVLEEVIIIKEGQIIRKQSIEELLAQAYTVAGEAGKVDQYTAGKNIRGAEMMGKYKSVTVLESLQSRDEARGRDLGLDFYKAELQKLFISLTNL